MKNKKKYQIYCDMDGVLVDFQSAVVKQINRDLKNKNVIGKKIEKLRKDLADLQRDHITEKDLDKINKENRLKSARKYMYRVASNNERFWANLPWMPEGKELWEYIKKYDPCILTTPLQDEASKKGKARWIEENLFPKPKKVIMSHEKYNWATDDNGQPNILIDDFTINTIPWEEKGGTSILYINASKAIKELKELMDESYII